VRWLALLLVASSAFADWEVTRSPFDPNLVARLKQQLHKNPDDEYAFKKLVDLYKKYRTLDQLVGEYEKSPDQIVLGHLFREKGDLDRAAQTYQAAGARLPLADLYLRQGKTHEALAIYSQLPPSKVVLRKLIDATLLPSSGLSGDEMVQQAGAAYRKLLDENPKDQDLRREYAEMLASHAHPKEAAIEYAHIADSLHADPGRHADAEKRIGELYELAGDPDAALAAYQKTYSIAPRDHHLRREAIDKIIGVYRKKDELRTLIGTWERDWPRDARGFVEWETLARLHDEVGDPARAKECFQKALSIDPHAIDARRRLIALLERAGKSDEALAEWRKLVAAAPGEPRFRLELAERLWKTPDGNKEAIALCERLGRDTSDPSIHATLAELYARWGLSDKALAEREKLVHLEPGDDSHLIALGELWYQRGKKDKALEIWKRILNVGNKKEQQLARLADVYAEHEMPADALDLYQKAVKLAPNDLNLQKGLAAALERVHRDVEAERLWLDLFAQAARAQKHGLMLELRQHLITLLQRQGKLGYRVGEWAAHVEPDPRVQAAWGLLAADAYLKLNRYDDAERLLTKFTDQKWDVETRADALMGLSQVYRQKRKLKEAVAALEQAAELMPSRAREIYAQIAELSLSLYHDADALAYAKKAIALGPADAQAQVRLGEVCERRDDTDGAVAAYQHAIELDDRLWRVYFTLARLQLRRGQLDAAARLYRDVMRRAPEEELVVDAARRAIDLEEYLGTLGELERELQPLAYAHPDRKVYQKLLVELYQRHAAAARKDKKELSRMGEHALRPLLDVLAPDSGADPAEEKQAMALLGELGNPGAAAPLLKLSLTTRRSPAKSPFASGVAPIDLRVEAALAGARVAGPDDLPQLLKLAEDPEKNVRAAAFFGLGRLNAPRAQEALVHGLSDGVPELQALACAGLGRQKARVKELVRVLRDGSRASVVRAACAVALGVIGDGEARGALSDTLDEGADELQEKAAWALGRLGARASTAALVKAVIIKRDPVRRAALDALGEAGGPIVWPDPVRNQDGLDVRSWISRLGATTPVTCVAVTLDTLELAAIFSDALSRHRDLQLRALDDLDALPDGIAAGPLTVEHRDELGLRLLQPLRKLAAGSDKVVAARALSVLGKISGAEAALAEAAASPRLEVRLAALQALQRPQPSLEAQLGHALGASDWRERRLAALALGGAADADRIRALAAALDDANGFVREAAAASLRRLSKEGEVPIQKAAQKALQGRFTGREEEHH
jgi:tetratricopeptide (TPR) repeat protein/HEAT repeat protein